MSDSLPPKVFISYAWTDEVHDARVLRLAEDLQMAGVEVIFDRWDLEAGQDVHHFMERSVGDPQVSKVLVILNKKYAERADARAGGVGTETMILSPEVYADPRQNRCIPLVFESENGRPTVPTYLKSRLYYDFSTDAAWQTNWQPLLRQLFGVAPNRPPLGSRPTHLLKNPERNSQGEVRRGQQGQLDATAPHSRIHQRLLEVLKWHDLDLVRAATLLKPFGFTAGILSSSERVVDHLDESVLDFLVNYFQVDRAFLLGGDVGPGVQAGIWYKDVRRLCQRIVELHNAGELEHLTFVTVPNSAIHNPQKWRLRGDVEDVLIVLVLKRRIGDHESYTYELWESGAWLYEKSRLDLKAIALFCELAHEKGISIYLRGGTFSRATFDAVNERRQHLAQVIEEGFVGFGQKWYPTDYVSATPHLTKNAEELPMLKSWYRRYRLDTIIERLSKPDDEP